jgi:hypothetical protein
MGSRETTSTTTKENEMKTWEEFKRYHGEGYFYGCVAPDGEWFDSAVDLSVAIHWCCYAAGEFELSLAEEMAWMETKGRDLGYSLVHSVMLEQMYEKGLLK